METLNLIKNDPWLEPYADAINGRHQHAINKEAELTNNGKKHFLILRPDIYTSDFTVLQTVGFSGNGLLTQPKYSLLVPLTIGKKKRNTA